MQTKGKVFEDFSELLTNAFGVAKDARHELETFVKSQFDRWLSQSNLVTREEFEVLQLLAEKTLKENEELQKRVKKLESATKKKS